MFGWLRRHSGKHRMSDEQTDSQPVTTGENNNNVKKVVRITLPDLTGVPVRSPVPPYDSHAKLPVKRAERPKASDTRAVEKPVQTQGKTQVKTVSKPRRSANSGYTPVPLSKLPLDENRSSAESNDQLRNLAASLEHTLQIFGIEDAKVDNIIHGPTITLSRLRSVKV